MNKSIDFQLIVNENGGYILYTSNNFYEISDEKFQEIFVPKIPEFWWNDNDRIVLLNSYEGGTSYHCERKKRYYDFKAQVYAFKVYEFQEADIEEFQKLYLIFLQLISELKQIQLKETSDSIREYVKQQGNLFKSNLESKRTELLKRSDWTQIADVPLSEVEKERWRLFRQKLRELGQDPNWIINDVMNVDFPISPIEYKIIDPEETEEYLSSPKHYVNPSILILKTKLLKVLERISDIEELNFRAKTGYLLPEEKEIYKSIDAVNTTVETSELQYTLSNLNYQKLMDYVNERLKKIDPDLVWEVSVVDKSSCSDCQL